ncbi:MAG: mechanosensitive ion channel family protein [Oscillatoriales cyanobacterium SM2_2_1]|nr:mechanosensitive ion channel family protein [Oscillatoriales cyanobacterium SM2_2_1]
MHRIFAVLCGAIATFLTILLTCSVPAQGQLPGLPDLSGGRLFEQPQSDRRDIKLHPIIFDGRRLFAIAGLSHIQGSGELTLQQRAAEIEINLYAIAQRLTDPSQIVSEVRVDERSQQPVIYINQQYLMTVTALDAESQGMPPRLWADEVIEMLGQSLVRYHQERQPEQQLQQVGIAIALLLALVVTHHLLERQRHRRLRHRAGHEQELTAMQQQEQESDVPANELFERKNLLQQQIANLDAQVRLMRLGEIASWGLGIAYILGLFPQTRWLQLWLIQGPGITLLRLAGVVIGITVANRLGDRLVQRLFQSVIHGRLWLPVGPSTTQSNQRFTRRVSTSIGVTQGVIRTLIAIIGALVALGTIGVSIEPIIASLGVIGLGVSLAAQDVIKDTISGLLILLEDQFAEGDVIVVDGKGGQVEHMNLRITQLRNTEGALITIPNSAIRAVDNLSNGWARVDMGINVSYNTDLDHAMAVIMDTAIAMSQERGWRQKILDHPELLGVDHFGDHSITLRLWIKVQPLKQWEVAREFRRRLKKAFDEAQISMPFPQQELWFRTPLALEPSQFKERPSQP